MYRYFLIILSHFFFIQTASAHDFWIQPASFSPQVGDQTGIHLFVGQYFRGEPIPRMSSWFDRFVYKNTRLKQVPQPIAGNEWSDPAGVIPFKQTGLYVLGFQSRHQSVVIEPATFALYLQEEGLDRIIKLREQREESSKTGNEYFLRCCKALIPVEDHGNDGYDHTFGFKLELVPQKNPLTLPAGAGLPFQLLFFGEPVEGVLVAALEYENPMQRITARTDANGMVKLKLPKLGHWLIKAVHMTEVTEDESFADWQSFWASFVFDNSKSSLY